MERSSGGTSECREMQTRPNHIFLIFFGLCSIPSQGQAPPFLCVGKLGIPRFCSASISWLPFNMDGQKVWFESPKWPCWSGITQLGPLYLAEQFGLGVKFRQGRPWGWDFWFFFPLSRPLQRNGTPTGSKFKINKQTTFLMFRRVWWCQSSPNSLFSRCRSVFVKVWPFFGHFPCGFLVECAAKQSSLFKDCPEFRVQTRWGFGGETTRSVSCHIEYCSSQTGWREQILLGYLRFYSKENGAGDKAWGLMRAQML